MPHYANTGPRIREMQDQLGRLLLANGAADIEHIADPQQQSEARLLELQIEGEKAARLAAMREHARALLKRAHEKRRAEMPERVARYAEQQKQRIRRAMAETGGRRSQVMRVLNIGAATLDRWLKQIRTDDAAAPAKCCPACGQRLPSLETPIQP